MRDSPPSSSTAASRPSHRRSKMLAALVSLAVVGLLAAHRGWQRPAPDSPATSASPSTSAVSGVLASRKLTTQHKGVSGLHGRVSDPGSAGIREAKVCAYPMQMEHVARSTPDLANPVCVTSNDDGRYAFVGIASGSYKLMASAPRYQPAAVETGNHEKLLALPEGEEIGPLDIVLRPGGVEVRGRVREAGSTTPIAGATVTLMLTDRTSGTMATSDRKGEFSAWIAEGALTVVAEATGYAPVTRQASSPGPKVDIELDHGGTLLVRVVDAETRQPLARAMVETGVPTQRFGQTDPDGRVTFDRLAAGRYKPRAMTRGYYGVLTRSVFVAAAEPASEAVIELHAVNTIEGRVVFHGSQRPCPAGEVTLHEGTTKTTFTTTIVSDGSFVFPTVPPGVYELIKTCKNAAKSIDANLLVVHSPMKDLVLEVAEGVTVHGVIVSEAGVPIRGATITGWGPVAPPRKGVFKVEATSDASGAFTLAGAVPTWVKLNATAASFAPIDPAVLVNITEGDRTDEVRLIMKRAATLEGVVEDQDGRPIPGLQVLADNGEERGYFTTFAVENGTFSFKSLPAGQLRVAVLMDSGEVTPDTHVALRNGETTKVRLMARRGTHEIWGTVVDTDGTPVPYARVEAAREGEFQEVSTPAPPPRSASPPLQLPSPPGPPPGAPQKEEKAHLSGPIGPAPNQKGTASKPPSLSSLPILQPVQPGQPASASAAGGNHVWMRAPVASRSAHPTQADASGAFKLTHLIEGKYTIRAYRDREGSSAEGVTLHIDTGDKSAVVALPATAAFEGQLSFPSAAAPPERFVVMLQSAALHLHRREEFFQTHGRFSFDDLAPGEYEAFVETAEWKGDMRVTLPTSSMTTIDMRERRGAKHGAARTR
jgi:protocatechuate 3,4-dioxygenase beta subunit